MSSTQIYFDGGVRPHPNGGFACCYGWVVKTNGAKMFEGGGVKKVERNIGSCAGEYTALIGALKSAIKRGLHRQPVEIVGDSQAVICLSSGAAVAQNNRVKNYCQVVSSLVKQFDDVRFQWVPREQNSEADKVGRVAYQQSPEILRRQSLIARVNAELCRAASRNKLSSEPGEWCFQLVGKKKLAQMSDADLQTISEALLALV